MAHARFLHECRVVTAVIDRVGDRFFRVGYFICFCVLCFMFCMCLFLSLLRTALAHPVPLSPCHFVFSCNPPLPLLASWNMMG